MYRRMRIILSIISVRVYKLAYSLGFMSWLILLRAYFEEQTGPTIFYAHSSVVSRPPFLGFIPWLFLLGVSFQEKTGPTIYYARTSVVSRICLSTCSPTRPPYALLFAPHRRRPCRQAHRHSSAAANSEQRQIRRTLTVSKYHAALVLVFGDSGARPQ